MENVIEKVDELISELDNTDFISKMKITKEEIESKHLINSSDVRSLYQNPIIHEYVENQNILDMHILYLNQKLKEITNNRISCESHKW